MKHRAVLAAFLTLCTVLWCGCSSKEPEILPPLDPYEAKATLSDADMNELVRYLSHPSVDVFGQERAEKLLRSAGLKVIPVVLRHLNAHGKKPTRMTEIKLRRILLTILKNIGNHVDGLDTADKEQQKKNITALRTISRKHFGYDHRATKKQRDAAVKKWRAWYESLYSPAVVDTLLAMFTTEIVGIKKAAAAALVAAGGDKVLPKVFALLHGEKTPPRRVQVELRKILLTLGAGRPEIIGDLIPMLDDDDEAIRHAAVLELRRQSKKRFGYDYGLPAAKRAPAVKQWRDWYQQEGKKKRGK